MLMYRGGYFGFQGSVALLITLEKNYQHSMYEDIRIMFVILKCQDRKEPPLRSVFHWLAIFLHRNMHEQSSSCFDGAH